MSVIKENDFVFPEYNNSNLSVMKDIVAKRSGRLGNEDKKIFLVTDGLGYDLLKTNILETGNSELLKRAEVNQISTLFPSTTTAVMNSIESGRTPAEHGVIGWDVYQKEYGLVVTPYRDATAFSKQMRLSAAGIGSVLPVPRLLMSAAEKNRMMRLLPEGIRPDKMENCTHVWYYDTTDMFVQLKKAIAKGEEGFIYAYYDGLDHLQHEYGYKHESVKRAVALFFRELSTILVPELRKNGYNLIITSDHGQIEADKKIILDSRSELLDYLAMPPWGDSRFLCLSVLPGKDGALARFFEKKYGKDAVLVESDELISTGIFGKKVIDKNVRMRFGTHMVLLKGNAVMKYLYPTEEKKGIGKKGFHSGLSALEMKIPLIVY